MCCFRLAGASAARAVGGRVAAAVATAAAVTNWRRDGVMAKPPEVEGSPSVIGGNAPLFFRCRGFRLREVLTELVRCLKALQEPVNLAVRSGKDASRVDLNVQGLRELHFLVAIDLECDEVADDGSPDFLVGKGLGLHPPT